MAEAPLPDDPGTVVPVSFKVGHELRAHEHDPKLADLVAQLEDCVEFDNRRVLYQWIGGPARDRGGQGGIPALIQAPGRWSAPDTSPPIPPKPHKQLFPTPPAPPPHPFYHP